MTLRTRLEKLEQAAPKRDGGIRMIWNSSVRRDGNGLLWERPIRAVLVQAPAAPNEVLERHESEGQAAFLGRVMDAVRRTDPASEEELRWRPDPGADWSE